VIKQKIKQLLTRIVRQTVKRTSIDYWTHRKATQQIKHTNEHQTKTNELKMMQSLPDKKNEDSAESTFRQELATLDVKRKSMEHEADAIFLELTTPPDEGVEPMGIDTPLVDQDGYPRGDIDIYRTRTLRRRFRTLKTDYKEITVKIESMLLQLAAMRVG
jgi:hypothetical protein